MRVPQAIATGRAAQTPESVSPLRAAAVAGVVAALFLLAIAFVRPPFLLTMFSEVETRLAREGGVEVTWMPPPDVNLDAVHRVVLDRLGDGRVHVRDRTLVIAIPGVPPEGIDDVVHLLSRSGVLAFHEVVQVDEMRRLAAILNLPMQDERPLDLFIDQWRADDSARPITDFYLFSTNRELLEAKLADARLQGWSLPPGTKLVLEEVAAVGTTPGGWRTYVIAEDAALDGASIENATVSFDPNWNTPLVLLEFDHAGAEIFGELTARIVGKKLAIVLDGVVKSAPVINSAIRGGSAQITMASSVHPQQQQAEAHALAAVLRVGSLPPGGEVIAARYLPRVPAANPTWLARAGFALGGGALLALLVWIVVRVTRPQWRPPVPRPEGRLSWSRLGVTFALPPIVVYAVGEITIRGIDREEVAYLTDGVAPPWAAIGVLGLMPVISACLLVEILAVIIPGWRRRRLAGPRLRAPLTLAAACLAVTLVIVQAHLLAVYLSSLPDIVPFGAWPRILIIGSLALGTGALVAVALLVRAHGLGNGFGVVLAAGWCVMFGKTWLAGPLFAKDIFVAGVTFLAIAVPVATLLRWRVARVGETPVAVPTSGVAPLGEAAGLVFVAITLSVFQFDDLNFRLAMWVGEARAHRWLLVGLLLASTLLWSFAFARPKRFAPLASRVGLAQPSSRTWWHATLLTAAALSVAGAAAMFALTAHPHAGWAIDAITIALVTAVALDIWADLRARRVALDRVWTLHQPQHADLVARALTDAGIPHHLSSLHLRTLLAFFGPFVPIEVLVPAEHAPAAQTKLRELFEP